MSDSKKSDPKRPSIEFLDDEPIIELVDEVSGGPADGDLSDLEKNLLSRLRLRLRHPSLIIQSNYSPQPPRLLAEKRHHNLKAHCQSLCQCPKKKGLWLLWRD